jgi:hypothetical protein
VQVEVEGCDPSHMYGAGHVLNRRHG